MLKLAHRKRPMERYPNQEVIIIETNEASDTEYSAKVEATIKDVLNEPLLRDIFRSGKQKDATLLRRRTMVYLDAIRRGRPVVMDKIIQGNSSEIDMGGNARRKYVRTDTGEIKWVMEPVSQDPFKQLDFYKELKNKGAPAEQIVEPMTDPFLVGRMLEEGLAIHDQLYSEFGQVVGKILNAESKYDTTLRYLKTPYIEIKEDLGYFTNLKKLFQRLGSSDAGRRHENFVLYLLKDPSILDTISQADQLCDQVAKFDDSIPNVVTTLIGVTGVTNRYTIDNTVAVELVASPNFPARIPDLKSPLTTLPKILLLNQIINELRNMPDPKGEKKFERAIGLIVADTFSTKQERIRTLLTGMGVDPDLGLEYFQNMLPEKLLALPYHDAISAIPGDPALPTHAVVLNNAYIMDQRVESAPSDPRRPDNSDQEDFIKYFPSNNSSHVLTKFRTWSSEDKKMVLTRLLNTDSIETYSMLTTKLLKAMHFGYSAKEGIFRFFNPHTEHTTLTTANSLNDIASGSILLEIGRDKVASGDIVSADVYEAIIRAAELPAWIVASDIFQGNWRNYSTKIGNLLRQYKRGEITTEDAKTQVLAQMAGSVLKLQNSEGEYLPLLDTARSGFIREVNSQSAESQFRERLYDLADTIKEVDILDRIDKIVADYQESRFGADYQTKKTTYIAEVLKHSIERAKALIPAT